jgi:3-hydroxymyristoyl/3-hydroxydecanoyl-(acyl carrier protein) dehydratase
MADSRAAIDSLRNAQGELDRAAIRRILPYGDAFLFVDGVTRLTSSEVEAFYRLPVDAPFISAHFVGLPIMPGVLVGEGLAQAGTLVVRYNLENHTGYDLLAHQIESARFPSPAQPGDTLQYDIRLLRLRRGAARLEGEARVGPCKICRARFDLVVVQRQHLQRELARVESE